MGMLRNCCKYVKSQARDRNVEEVLATDEGLGSGVDDGDEEEGDGEPPSRIVHVEIAESDELETADGISGNRRWRREL